MVRGLDLFRQFFAAHADKYVLIGGTAATLTMEEAGLAFRATKDLDVVLHIEALDAEFGVTFWDFIDSGDYEIRQASATGKPVYYRFQKPRNQNYPAMLELFCRAPAGIALAPGTRLTPIPVDEAVASLSAILMDHDYYEFVITGRRITDDLPRIGEDRLIPLKAVAWLDMKERASRGESLDSRDIRKHANDALRLSQLLAPNARIQVAAKIAADLNRFLDAILAEADIHPSALGLKGTLSELVERIRTTYT